MARLSARPMYPRWVESLRNQCVSAGVAYFFKQWGAYAPVTIDDRHGPIEPRERTELWVHPDGSTSDRAHTKDFAWPMQRIGKKAAGRTLDGRTWDELPQGVRRETQ